MTKKDFSQTMLKEKKIMAVIVLAFIVAITGFGLYAFYSVSDNPEQQQACIDSGKTISAIAAMAKGDLAAFQPVSKPIHLAGLSFKDKNGGAVSLADWKGRTVLLNLWATWCAPCRREMPALEKLQQDLGGDEFEVVPVSVDLGDDTKPKAFYKKTGLKDLPFYADGTMEVFNILKKNGLAFGMPTTVLIGKDGCSLGVINGPAEWAGADAKALIRAAM